LLGVGSSIPRLVKGTSRPQWVGLETKGFREPRVLGGPATGSTLALTPCRCWPTAQFNS